MKQTMEHRPLFNIPTLLIAGIGEMVVSDNPEETLATYSLGSCVGLSLYDPELCLGGLVHCMLPLSNMDVARALDRPCLFTDTGIYALLRALLDRGASKRRLLAKVAGGAAALGDDSIFNIGERNYQVLKRVLQKNQIPIAAEAVGGALGRTMYLRMRDGATVVRIGATKTLL